MSMWSLHLRAPMAAFRSRKSETSRVNCASSCLLIGTHFIVSVHVHATAGYVQPLYFGTSSNYNGQYSRLLDSVPSSKDTPRWTMAVDPEKLYQNRQRRDLWVGWLECSAYEAFGTSVGWLCRPARSYVAQRTPTHFAQPLPRVRR